MNREPYWGQSTVIFSKSSLAAIILAGAVTVAVIAYSTTLGAPAVIIENDHLLLESRYHEARFELSSLDLSQARSGDWHRKSPYWPASRISGNSSTREGIYTLANGERAYVVNTGSGQLLYLPLDDTLVLVYRADDAHDVLQHLRRLQMQGQAQ